MKKYNNRVFVAIVCLLMAMLAVLGVSYELFLKIVKEDTFNSLTKDINLVITEIDQMLLSNNDIVSRVKNIDELSDEKTQTLTMVDYVNIRNDLNAMMSNKESYITDIIVYPKDGDYIVNQNASFEKDSYFDTFYGNTIYTKAFWESLFKESFVNRYFAASDFGYTGRLYDSNVQEIIPFVSKDRYQSNHLVIVMIDAQKLRNSVDQPLNDTLFALSTQGMILYENYYADFTYDQLEELLEEKLERKINEPDGSIRYIKKSAETGIIYSDYISMEKLNHDLFEKHSMPMFVTLLMVIFGIAVAFILSRYITRPISDLRRLLEKNATNESENEMQFITNQVDSMMTQNNTYSLELEEKKNQLLEFVYLSKFKKIYSKTPLTGTALEVQEEKQYILIYIKVNEYDYNDIYTLKDVVHTKLKHLHLKFVLVMGGEEIVLSVSLKEGETLATIQDELTALFCDELQKQCFTIVIGKPYSKESMSAEMYEELVKGSKFTQLTRETQIISLTDDGYTKGMYTFFTPNERKKLYDNIFSGQKEAVTESIVALLTYNAQRNIKNYHLQILCQRIINLCMNILQDAKSGVSSNIDLEALWSHLTTLYYFEDYVDRMEQFVEALIANMPNTSQEREDPIVRKIKEYVQENYTKDFSLEQLSFDLSISRSYLSTYFKEKTNVNISTYINNYRIMKSLDLFKNKNMTVNEISEAVGIYNVNTFIRLFKKYMGTTPGNYRKEL